MKRRPSQGCTEFQDLCLPSRRSVLQAGMLGSLGLSLPEFFQRQAIAEATETTSGRKRAKACIFMFMWGGPSQIDTFDPKPNAPENVRGPFKPIATTVPSIQISENFQKTSKLAEHFSIVRSLTHDDPAHLSSAHTVLTGQLPRVNKSDAEPPSNNDTPHVGSVVSRLFPAGQGMPSFVTIPWRVLHPAAPGGHAPGQTGGWLGRSYDPFLITGDPGKPDWKVPALKLQEGLDPERLNRRRSLLKTLETEQTLLNNIAANNPMTLHQDKAFGLLTSGKVRQAFDLNKESAAMRDRYGRNIHGQSVLLARRLVEHGVPLVSVNWHNDGRNFWDTHGNNFNRLKDDLIPPSDQALAALLGDLQDRGMLDETLIVWVGEFGRSPVINASAGREHHPSCYSGLLAGGGIQGGSVYGMSDQHARYPAQQPVSPRDMAATILHAMGVDEEATLPDRLNRSKKLFGGKPLASLFG